MRQKITDFVYIGIFRPKDLRSSSFRDKLYLLKRLGIGLIVVSKRSKIVETERADIMNGVVLIVQIIRATGIMPGGQYIIIRQE